jgi:hypothetical protein
LIDEAANDSSQAGYRDCYLLCLFAIATSASVEGESERVTTEAEEPLGYASPFVNGW